MARDPSKTETATPKRRDKAREKGSVPRSQELPKLTVLVAGLLTLRLGIGFFTEQMREVFVLFLGGRLAFTPTPDNVTMIFWVLTKKLALMLLPILTVMAIIAYITQRLQVGSLWAPKVFKFDLSRMFNPMAGLEKNPHRTRALTSSASGGHGRHHRLARTSSSKRVQRLPPLFTVCRNGRSLHVGKVFYHGAIYHRAHVGHHVLDVWSTRWNTRKSSR
jgi:flagellar biosynthetic protein FlhB